MVRQTVIGILIAGSVGSALYFFMNPVQMRSFFAYSNGAKLTSTCEEMILRRLKSPSSYKLVKSSYSKEKASLDDVIQFEKKFPNPIGPTLVQKQIFARSGAYRHRVFIEYDADNSFGASVRDLALCEDVNLGTSIDPSFYSILINGKPYF
jgi:hypothetical protein